MARYPVTGEEEHDLCTTYTVCVKVVQRECPQVPLQYSSTHALSLVLSIYAVELSPFRVPTSAVGTQS